MVQVFGNRIIGGIGAPGGGMADAYAGGVNTALNQQTSRQAMAAEAQRMRMLEQEFAWKGEDREEAKRRAAAAEAASAAARARNARIAEERLRIMGGAGGAPAAATVGPVQGPPAPAAPTTPGLRVPVAPSAGPLTFGSGVGPQASAAPGAILGADGQPMSLTDIQFVRGEMGAAPPGAMGAYAGADGSLYLGGSPRDAAEYARNLAARPGAYQAAANQERLDMARRVAAGPQTIGGDARKLELAQAELAAAKEDFARSGSGEDLADVARWSAEVNRLTPLAEEYQTTQESYPIGRDVFALEGPESTGAAEVFARQAEEQRAGAAAAAKDAQLSSLMEQSLLGSARGGDFQQGLVFGGSGNLTFGPQLGATPQTTEQIAIDNFVNQTGIDPYAPAPPAPPPMREPGAPNRAVAGLLSKRDQQVQLIELYTKEGLYGEAEALYLELANTDAQLEAAAARLALQEATMFNSPQRLGVVWSTIYNREVEFRPTAEGGFDMLVDGELLEANIDPATLERNTLMMSDAAFAAKQEELAMLTETEYAKGIGQGRAEVVKQGQLAGIELQKQEVLADIAVSQDMGAKMNDLQKQQLEFILRQEGKLPAEPRNYEYKEGDDNSIAIFDGAKLVAYFVRGTTTNTAGEQVPTLTEVRE